jgi:hypothetical protein
MTMSCLKLDVIQQWEMKKEKNPARLPVLLVHYIPWTGENVGSSCENYRA